MLHQVIMHSHEYTGLEYETYPCSLSRNCAKPQVELMGAQSADPALCLFSADTSPSLLALSIKICLFMWYWLCVFEDRKTVSLLCHSGDDQV